MFTTLRKNVGCYRRDRSGPNDEKQVDLPWICDISGLRATPIRQPESNRGTVRDGAHARMSAATAAKADVGFQPESVPSRRLEATGSALVLRRPHL